MYGALVASNSRLNTSLFWAPVWSDEQKGIDVDLGTDRLIVAIRTRNIENSNHYLRSFAIYSGIDGSAELVPAMDSSGAEVVFEIVEFSNDILNHALPIPIIARYVRLKIISFDGQTPALSWAVDGCALSPE